jgi:Domain of unknown function (DUF222)
VDERENHGFGSFPDSGLYADANAAADAEFDEFTAWLDREVAAGRNPFPPERALTQGISVSLGAGDGIDEELLAAVGGTDANGAELGAQFSQGAAADAFPPSPVLAALTEETVPDVRRLSDNQLIGVLQAAQRQENREAWKKALVIAEFARRRTAEFEAAKARGVPVHCRPGQFPGEELAIELLLGPVQAAHAIDDATDLATRLPATLAGMAAGLIDEARAGVIALHTRCLSPEHAALADEVLAVLAPGLRLDQLARKAAALEMKLDPEAAKARREHARLTRQRVEVRREVSGNASVAGREMDTADALAAKAHIHALALRLRRAGVPGTLDQLRLLVFSDLTAGRDPIDRLTGAAVPDAGQDGASAEPSNPASPAAGPGGPREETWNGDSKALDGDRTASLDYDHGDWSDSAGTAGHPRPPAPMPATINLVVHAGTLFGWDTAPSEAGEWGLLDADETRVIVAAAAQHPATRWCFTLLARDGTAAAHGCSPGRHPWTPRDYPGSLGPPGRPASPSPWDQGDFASTAGPRTPTATQAAQFAAFLRSLNLRLEPIAKGGCDHTSAEPRYSPSRRLTHLVRARSATCDAPGCNAQALHTDLDHTIPYPDGPTDQCNLGPKCRRHHKVKQAPGWQVEQSEPGVIRWTLPSGRTHTTRPTVFG